MAFTYSLQSKNLINLPKLYFFSFVLGCEKSDVVVKSVESQRSLSFQDSSRTIDIVSVELLTMTNPSLLDVFVPRTTVGDGNCLFRAASIAMYDDETRHTELRQLTFQEIRDNPTWYNKNDPNYCSPFANDPGIMIENYAYYFVNTPKEGNWSDMNDMLALSAVLNTPIKSVFPSIDGDDSPYSKVLIGRNVSLNEKSEAKVTVLWTSLALPNRIENFSPNHFVPLIAKTSENVSQSPDSVALLKVEETTNSNLHTINPMKSSYDDKAKTLTRNQ